MNQRPRVSAFDPSLIDRLLAEQGVLSAVDAFTRAQRHPAPAGSYRALIPLSAPGPDKQFNFEVDLDQCSGCKACVAACHSLNGLEEDESWRETGVLISGDPRHPFRQEITTACHHCLDPGCLKGCPVLAYEKDPITGIVRHLDDQCIGCQYCLLTCPYEVPKYSRTKGIVRKCDMCSQRLAAQEAPACAQACPNDAIRITVAHRQTVETNFRSAISLAQSPAQGWNNRFLPASPNPAITLPTTRYLRRQPWPDSMVPGDAGVTSLQPAHAPLVWMLVLTQMGAGALALAAFIPEISPHALILPAMAATLAGLAGSILHLGRPLEAWRAFLGIRQSWLSREIAAFTLFAILGAAAALASWIPDRLPPGIVETLVPAAALAGLAGVLCSGMVYHVTGRVFWRGARVFGKFLGTTALLGLGAAWAVSTLASSEPSSLPAFIALAATLKLAGELECLGRARSALARQPWPANGEVDSWSLGRTARLMREQLGAWTGLRFCCGVLGGVVLPLLSFITSGMAGGLAWTSLLLCCLGELAERHAFFRAVVPPKMPGNL